MNLGGMRAPYPVGEQTGLEISRILTMWEALLERHTGKGPYLFGEWGMADCMVLPAATRFRAYGVELAAYPGSKAYVEALHALEAFQE